MCFLAIRKSRLTQDINRCFYGVEGRKKDFSFCWTANYRPAALRKLIEAILTNVSVSLVLACLLSTQLRLSAALTRSPLLFITFMLLLHALSNIKIGAFASLLLSRWKIRSHFFEFIWKKDVRKNSTSWLWLASLLQTFLLLFRLSWIFLRCCSLCKIPGPYRALFNSSSPFFLKGIIIS